MEDFTIMTDSSANLTPDLVQEAQIEVIPLTCLTDAGEMPENVHGELRPVYPRL